MLVSSRKRPITALDETAAFSSVSNGSASTDSSRPPRFCRSTKLELEDERGSARHTSRGGPAMPTTGGDRGGGLAPAHRRNLEPAHSYKQTLSKVIAAARQRNASSGNTAGSRLSVPTQEGESWGGSAPAPSNNFYLALGNNYYEPTPYGYTPVDYEPLSPWEGEEEADARHDRVPPADSLTPSWRGEQGSAAQMAALLQAAHSAAGQEYRPVKCGPNTAGPRQEDYADPYDDGQPLPKAPRRQLTKQILAELDSAAPDAIQSEADGFPYHGSIRTRNALFLDTELRTGSAMVGFLRTAKVDTLIGGTVDLATDPGALARVSNGVFFTAIRTAWANYQSLSSMMSSGLHRQG